MKIIQSESWFYVNILLVLLFLPFFNLKAETLPATSDTVTGDISLVQDFLNIKVYSDFENEIAKEVLPGLLFLFIPEVGREKISVTLENLPDRDLYFYVDSLENKLVHLSSEPRSLTFTLNGQRPHIIYTKLQQSTKIIRNDDTGGDCSTFGTWNKDTLTCTMTQDVFEVIEIAGDGITLDGNDRTVKWNKGFGIGSGINISFRKNVVIKNLTVEGFDQGFGIFQTRDSKFLNNKTFGFGSGFYLAFNDLDNLIEGNTITNTADYLPGVTASGIYLWNGVQRTIINKNTISVTNAGIVLIEANNNRVYNNNITSINKNVHSSNNFINTIYQPLPIGGNYYSGYDTPSEGCHDVNKDFICDNPITFGNVTDHYPWTRKDGWLPQPQSLAEKAVELAKQVIEADYLGDGDTYGGKGWDPKRSLYVTVNEIFDGYNYWNNKLRKVAFGAGLDCSGLIQWSFNHAFDPNKSLLKNVVRYDGADGQYKNNSEPIVESDLKPGDLLFLDRGNDNFMDHVAMYVGDGDGHDIVEAFSPERGIITSRKDLFKERNGFKNVSNPIRRLTLHPLIAGNIKAGSPIDLVVTDPDGLTITPTSTVQTDEEYLTEIPGELYYSENEIGLDGRPQDVVYWPVDKMGDYNVRILPESGTHKDDKYSLYFTVGGNTLTLAKDVPIEQIPEDGYGVTVGSGQTISHFIPVQIDLKPGSPINTFNLNSKGVTPVAILGTKSLDVRKIDAHSIRLSGGLVRIEGNEKPLISYADLNNDGFVDLLIKVSTETILADVSDTKLSLEGSLTTGEVIKGSDFINIVTQ